MEESRIFQILKFAAEREKEDQGFSAKELETATGLTWGVLRNYAYRLAPGDQWVDGIFALENGSPLQRGNENQQQRLKVLSGWQWSSFLLPRGLFSAIKISD